MDKVVQKFTMNGIIYRQYYDERNNRYYWLSDIQ